MKATEIQEHFNSFESIAIEYEGVECWSARELSLALGHSQYRNFLAVIEKAKRCYYSELVSNDSKETSI